MFNVNAYVIAIGTMLLLLGIKKTIKSDKKQELSDPPIINGSNSDLQKKDKKLNV